MLRRRSAASTMDYGLVWNTVLATGGVAVVGDEVKISLELQFQRPAYTNYCVKRLARSDVALLFAFPRAQMRGRDASWRSFRKLRNEPTLDETRVRLHGYIACAGDDQHRLGIPFGSTRATVFGACICV